MEPSSLAIVEENIYEEVDIYWEAITILGEEITVFDSAAFSKKISSDLEREKVSEAEEDGGRVEMNSAIEESD